MLLTSALIQLPTRDDWAGKLKAGGKYLATRNGSSIAAFTVGKAYKPGNGVAVVAGHIDALTAKLKPVSNKPNKAGYLQLGVAPYAGALNETWWDRDLTIGGRVIVRDPDTGKTMSKLVKLDWPMYVYHQLHPSPPPPPPPSNHFPPQRIQLVDILTMFKPVHVSAPSPHTSGLV